MDLKDISALLDKYGIKGIIFLFLILSIISAFNTNWFSKLLGKVSDIFVNKFMKNKVKNIKNTNNTISESNIINHDIFNYIDFWLYSKVPTIQFSTEYRTVVFRKYLSLYLKSFKTKTIEFINEKEYQEMDESKLLKALLDLINDIIYDYETESLNSNIPKIIVDKMKAKNTDTISLTIDLIEGICNSRFNDSENNLLKIYSVLNILLSILESTISNSENVCNSINGNLKGFIFTVNGKMYVEPNETPKIL